MAALRRAWLWFIKHTLSRATARSARTKGGRLSLVRHVGRKSGRTFETPIVVLRLLRRHEFRLLRAAGERR